MKISLAVIATVFVICACKKEQIDVNSFIQCHNIQNLDSTAISNKLVGSWEWVKTYCANSGKPKKADRTLVLTFNSNATFTLVENSNPIAQGIWKLKIVDNNLWGLDLTTLSNYLYGRIFFCDNQVLFNNSYVDGCDNLFTRK